MTASLTIDDPILETFAAEVEGTDPITVVGARTAWDRGGTLDGTPREVRAPAGIVAYAPEEMTVTVRAGTPVAELDAALAAANQRCALVDRGGTVGGAVAVGENDPLVLGKGRLRDSVLQVRYVAADGRLITGGGPTVKNVTGFDLPRLMTGALGTLGFLGEVILRTNPTPAVATWFRSDDADPFNTFDALLHPSAVFWNGVTTWVLLEGHPVDVAAEAGVLTGVGAFTETDGPPPLPPHRWSLTPSDLRTVDLDDFVASIGVGIVHAGQPQPALAMDPAAEEVAGRVKAEFDPAGRWNPGRERSG